MKVVILCGGYGTRLAPAALDAPKPMVPIGGRPIVWHIMRAFAHQGFNDFLLALGYRSEAFKQYFVNLPTMLSDVSVDLATGSVRHLQDEPLDWRVGLIETGLDSMTGARVKKLERHIPEDDDCFLVTYGDGVTDLDVRKLVAFHRSHGKIATVTAVRPPGRFGELGLESDGRVRAFNEKPQAEAGWISGGFFVFDRRIFDRLGDDPELALEEEPARSLVEDNEIMAWQHDGFWYCVDTPRDYRNLQAMWSQGKAPWAVWTNDG